LEINKPDKTGAVETEITAVPDGQPHAEPLSRAVHPDDWLCALCHNNIAADSARFFYNGTSEFEFTNPAGGRFHVITFSSAGGCRISGNPTLEHTWFNGHQWTLAHCNQCGIQLGWQYAGRYAFYGLIRTHLVPGFSALN
jgi:hypothetical protein